MVFMILLAATVLMSILGFVMMGIDKRKAKRNEWRTKEATLFLVAALLGGIGGTAGMFAFRHKTKHWYFRYGFPLLALLQTALLVYAFIAWR